MSRSKTVVIAKLAYVRPATANAEYLPVKPVLRSDIPGSAMTHPLPGTSTVRKLRWRCTRHHSLRSFGTALERDIH